MEERFSWNLEVAISPLQEGQSRERAVVGNCPEEQERKNDINSVKICDYGSGTEFIE